DRGELGDGELREPDGLLSLAHAQEALCERDLRAEQRRVADAGGGGCAGERLLAQRALLLQPPLGAQRVGEQPAQLELVLQVEDADVERGRERLARLFGTADRERRDGEALQR